ncbi:capsid protein [Crucivirus-119]|nr:capsid protein [Crucivirus-119]
MLPKNVYMNLSKKDKAKVKRNIASKAKGSGAYDLATQPYGYYGSKIGRALGTSFYGPAGGAVGDVAAGYLGHRIGRMFGSGAYKSKRIPNYTGAHKMIRGSGAYDMPAQGRVITEGTSPPSFGSNRTIIRHREYIGNLNSSTAFNLNSYNVNPGDETTFPWLAGIATNYQKYRPLGVLFEFKSTSANALNSTNTALGTVMMAVSYNAIASSAPGSKMEMLQLEGCTSICPAESAMCAVECAKNYNPLSTLYIRNGVAFQVPNGAEQFYDFANFYIATEGMQAANVVIGELWATYEFELLTPVLNDGQVGNDVNFSNYLLSSGASTSNYFPSPSASLNIQTMNLTFTATTISLPANITTGCYQLLWYLVGSTGASSAPSIAFSNAVALPIFSGNTVSRPTSTAQSATTQIVVQSFKVTGPNATLTFSGGTILTGSTGGSVELVQLPGVVGQGI